MASLALNTTPLTMQQAAHLLRRTTFVYTKERVDELTNMSPSDAIDSLLTTLPAPYLTEPIDYQTGQTWINSGVDPVSNTGNQRKYVRAWWIDEARRDPSINHKMIFFLHSNFVIAPVEGTAAEYFDYLQLLRWGSLGNFKTLSRKMILDNQMLRYLDNKDNRKGRPNENFAREFMELFTIGKGEQIAAGDYTNYTEADIVASAKVLTGFQLGGRVDNIDSDTGLPMGRANYNRHETTDNTFSSAFNNHTITVATNAEGMFQELDDYVDMIFAQNATATHICRKLYRYFVNTNVTPEIEQDIIIPLAATFRANNYELLPVLSQLLKSEHFYDLDDSDNSDETVGGMIRSPLDLILQSLNFFKINIPDPITQSEDHYSNFYKRFVIDTFLAIAGMPVLNPESVAGYPAYYQEPTFHRNWFNSSTIVARYRLPDMLFQGKRLLAGGTIGGVQLDIVDFVENNFSNPSSASFVCGEFINYLLPVPPDNERFEHFLREEFMSGLPLSDWSYEWDAYLQSGDKTEVKIGLENLVRALMYSQEFQMG